MREDKYCSKENLSLLRSFNLNSLFGVEKMRKVSTQRGIYQSVDDVELDKKEGVVTHLKHFDSMPLFRKKQVGQRYQISSYLLQIL